MPLDSWPLGLAISQAKPAPSARMPRCSGFWRGGVFFREGGTFKESPPPRYSLVDNWDDQFATLFGFSGLWPAK